MGRSGINEEYMGDCFSSFSQDQVGRFSPVKCSDFVLFFFSPVLPRHFQPWEMSSAPSTTTLCMRRSVITSRCVTRNTRMFITPAMLLATTVLLLVTRLVTAMATAIMESVKLMLVTPVVLTARSMLRRRVTRSLSKTRTKSHTRSATQSQSVIQLLLKFPTKFVLVSASPSQGQNTEWHSFTEQIS